MNFVHLHNHTEYSLLDGLGTCQDYAKRAKEQGQEYLAITDHGNVDGVIKFQEACKVEGIKPIIGCEFYIVKDITKKEKGEKRNHITILIKNQTGWENVLKMLTIASTDGFFYRPRISPEILMDHGEGIVVMSGCALSPLSEEWGRNLVLGMSEITDTFIELMPHNFNLQLDMNKIGTAFSEKNHLHMVATNDCHYVNNGDEYYQEVLLAIQSRKKWKDKDRWKFDVDGLYLKSRSEMARAFKEQGVFGLKEIGTALENTMMIAELCKDFEIKPIPVNLPPVPVLGKEKDEEALQRLCIEGIENKIKSIPYKKKKLKEYEERWKEEYETITRQGFARYFLIVWEMVHWCKSNDIMVGPGRGSCGGSLIVYLLGITTVDPLDFGLIFARFISPARIDLPDIDLDFEDIKRPLVRKHLEDIYGKNNVAGVSTFSSMKGRGALRDVSRVFDIPLVDVNKASNCIVVRSGGDARTDYSIKDAFETFEDGKRFGKKYPKVTETAIKLEGQLRGKGQHAAAMIISAENLREGKRAYLRYGKEETIVNWEKTDIEHQGIMKLDVLGLNALTVLNSTRKLVIANGGKDINFESLPLTDKKIFEEFTKGNTIGCFQVGSLGLKRFCQQLGIDDFEMLVHATSLYRPGTLRSGMTNEFVLRKKGEKKWKEIHPILSEITKNTFGIILYQEQVMRFMYDLGGLGWKTADTVRKVISKSQGVEQFLKFKEMFADGCVERKTLDRETAEKLWDELASFGSYGFNLSHAVEYSIITYWDMYCKIYHPKEFICASMTYGNEQKKEDYIEEAIRLGIDVRPPKKGISDSKNWIIKKGILYCPFLEIKGIGEKTAGQLKSFSERGFYSDGKKISKKFEAILLDIRYDKDEPIEPEEAERIAKYFQFSFSKDKYRKVKKIGQKIKSVLKIRNVKDIDFNKIEKEYSNYFGRMTEIKFGYRGKFDSLDKKLGVTGGADSLGGVYGNFEDETDFCMLVFDTPIYKEKKEKIEHCSDNLIIAKANQPRRAGSILCSNVWVEADIMSGDLTDLGLKLAKPSRFKNREVLSCTGCSLREECKAPVISSTGKYNIMILGEAPGRDEDKNGEGFVGDSGKLLWREIEKYDFTRKDFNVTNIVKCWPSKTKTPSKSQIKSCSRWIDEEIKEIDPFVVLAFGNTSMKYILGEESGIMNKNGTTEWNDKLNTWVCWCIHPASVLYSPENKELFKAGIKNFIDKVRVLGGL